MTESTMDLASARRKILDELAQGGQASDAPARLALAMDDYFRRRLEETRDDAPLQPPFVLLAVGGYGRRQLCPGSDIDVLLVYREDPGPRDGHIEQILSDQPVSPDAPTCSDSMTGPDEPTAMESLAGHLFHPLWDLRLAVGHGVRSLEECLDLAAEDPQVLASLLDMRLIAGDLGIFWELRERMQKALGRALPSSNSSHQGGHFQTWTPEPRISGQQDEPADQVSHELAMGLVAPTHRRRNKAHTAGGPGGMIPPGRRRLFQLHIDARHFAAWLAQSAPEGDAPGLEPDLKSGPGGLRDAHRLAWLGKLFPQAEGFFEPAERQELEGHAEFLLTVRTQLHAIGGGKGNVLHQELQPAVAERMGFDGSPGLAAEGLLAGVQTAMTGLRMAREALLDSLLGHETLRPGLYSSPADWPELGFLLFLRMAFSGQPLSWESRRAVRQGLARAPATVASAPMALSFLRRVLPAPYGADALSAMLETGFLAVLLPELGQAQHLVQFDGLHQHPVGRHSIEAVRELGVLARDPRLGALLEELSGGQRDALFLAGLLHDAGKGGPDHEARGAVLARDMLDRLGAPRSMITDVTFLVSQHLLLPVTAVRSDLGDEVVSASVARAAESLPRLTMLHLLSVADSKATGPRAWNGWKAALMGELYTKARRLLERGWLSTSDAMRRALTTRDRVRGLARGGYDQTFVEAALAAMPPRYVQALDAATIVSHFPLVLEFRKELEDERRRVPHGRGGLGLAIVRARRLEGAKAWELTVAAMNQPRFFATMAGVLSLHGLNILHAEVFTWSDGTVLDIFTLAEPPDRLQPQEVFERVRLGIKNALTGKLKLDERLAERRRSPLNRCRTGAAACPEVRVDNEASDFYTVLEVRAADRPGRLYELAMALDRLGLSVFLAKIDTMGERVADIFFVRDGDGQKLDRNCADEVAQALRDAAIS
ncbi:HD domain-containing protein [Desulfocurvibacter africanus]|uniref:[protein-PII] uridylyltransferase family protein n=1 Tax=Desulfocurvibacter africanus TaxID=873 RepID=UPI00048749C9|nr:HD domain-containing protein [Desulfocurvibacter africanus]